MRNVFLAGVFLAALGANPACAGLVNWDLTANPGLLGVTQGFTADGFSLTARGFDGSDLGTRLFAKTDAGDERGLGLANDPAGNDEISGRNFIQLNLDGLLSKVHGFEFSMGSTTQGEGWAVFGSEDAHPFQFTLLASSVGVNDEGIHSLPGGFDNYNFFYNGLGRGECGGGCNANVILSSFAATANVPEPQTWAMMGIGFALMGFLGLKQRNRLASL